MAVLQDISRWIAATIYTYKERQADRYMNKIKGALERMNKLQVYNPYRAGVPSSLYNENRFTQNLTESWIWYQGKEVALNDYYKNQTGTTDNASELSYFWYKSPDDGSIRRVHSGLPKLISDTMPTVLFGNGYEIKATSYLEDGNTVNEPLTMQLQEEIDLLSNVEGINIKNLLEQSASAESWSGDIAWKIAIDTDISPYPIIMAHDPRNYEPLVVKGVTIGIKFKDYKEVKQGNNTRYYIINEIYTTDKLDGTSLIVYTVDEVKKSSTSSAITPVQLTSVPDSDIQALLEQQGVIVSADGLSATIRFDGLKGILAWHKPNKVNNADGYNALFGESDHQGNFSNYDSLDEVVSEIVAETRTNKTRLHIPENMFKRVDGRLQSFNNFTNSYVQTSSVGDAIGQEKIQVTSIDDKTMQHIEKFKIYLGMACAVAKISPLTLGLTNMVSMSNSDKTLQERSRVTVETRKKKLELWKPFLEKVFYKLVEVYAYMQRVYPEVKNKAMFEAVDITEKQFTLNVSFADYNEMGILDRAKEWSVVLQQGGISIEEYVDKVHGNSMTDEQKQMEVSNIKIQRNIGVNNPDLMSLNDLEQPI